MLPSTQGAAAAVPAPRTGRPLPAQPADRRADDHARTVSLSRDTVRIDRTVGGIAMRVAVPVRNYQGVALTLASDAEGALAYRLHLVHADRDLCVALDEASDDQDIVADWRLWSRFLRLPALVERRPGAVERADPSLGDLLLGEGATERRPRRSRRRPRFLLRRKTGVLGATPVVHAGECELIARS